MFNVLIYHTIRIHKMHVILFCWWQNCLGILTYINNPPEIRKKFFFYQCRMVKKSRIFSIYILCFLNSWLMITFNSIFYISLFFVNTIICLLVIHRIFLLKSVESAVMLLSLTIFMINCWRFFSFNGVFIEYKR